MVRLLRRTLLLLGAYVALLATVVVAGFLGSAVGIWASVFWGVGVLAGVVIYVRQRLARTA
jgi:hypothetical protein